METADHSPASLTALQAEVDRLKAELSELKERSLAGREERRAALNLMEDAVHARRELERENIERQRAEVALRSSEEKYRSLFESIDEGFCIIDVLFDPNGQPYDYRFVEVNPAFEQQTGFSGILGQTMRQLAPSLETHWYEIYGRVATTGESVRFENEAAAIGRYYDVYAFRVGAPIQKRVAVLFRDIAERKRQELNTAFLDLVGQDLSRIMMPDEIMQTAGARLGAYLRLSGCLFVDVAPDQDEVTMHYGWTDSGVPSLKQCFCLHDFVTDAFQQAAREGEAFVVNDTAQDERTSTENYARLQIGSLVTIPFHQNGVWTQYFCVTATEPRAWEPHEIALLREASERLFARVERARAEQALRANEAWLAHQKEAFQAAMNGAPLEDSLSVLVRAAIEQTGTEARCAFYLANADKTGLHHITGMSASYAFCVDGFKIGADSLSCGLAAHLGQPVITPDVQKDPRWQPWLWMTEEHDYRASWSFPLETTEGKILGTFAMYFREPRAATSRDIERAAALTQAAAIIISRHQEAEERARADVALRLAKEEAEAANRAKDDFLAALSHELRNPLNPVLLCASDLAVDPTLPEEVRQSLRMIHRNIELEARLIDDLLDLTRITRGLMRLESSGCDAHALLRHTEEIIRVDAAAAGVTVEFALDASEFHVLADAARLQQVFWNLIKNGIKFSASQGVTRLNGGGSENSHTLSHSNGNGDDSRTVPGKVRVHTFNPVPGQLTVEVHDNGIGISETALAKIFRPFDRGDHIGDHRFGGLGLGLAISKAVVDLHGGQLRAATAGLGAGSTFTVEMAAFAAPLTQDAPAGGKPTLDATPLRLLVVEDHEPTIQVITRVLQRDGHRVHIARSATEALTFATNGEWHCDLVISDIGLPDLSGVELMRQLRTLRGWRGIALSGYGMDADIRESLAAGFHAHLVKPLQMDVVRRAIREAVVG